MDCAVGQIRRSAGVRFHSALAGPRQNGGGPGHPSGRGPGPPSGERHLIRISRKPFPGNPTHAAPPRKNRARIPESKAFYQAFVCAFHKRHERNGSPPAQPEGSRFCFFWHTPMKRKSLFFIARHRAGVSGDGTCAPGAAGDRLQRRLFPKHLRFPGKQYRYEARKSGGGFPVRRSVCKSALRGAALIPGASAAGASAARGRRSAGGGRPSGER